MLDYSQKVRDELDAWMRPFAPSVVIAKSFRGEEPSGAPASAVNDPPEDGDLFAGIDMDNLPDEVRETLLKKVKPAIASLQTTNATLASEKEKSEKLARQHQARADQFHTRLQKHGLIEDPNAPAVPQQNANDKLQAELATEFEADGMPKEQAVAFAKLMAKTFGKFKDRTLSEVGGALGPMAVNVGAMQVDRMLLNAANTEQFANVLAEPEVMNMARETLLTLVQNGNRVDQALLDTAIKMAVGEMTMKGTTEQPNSRPGPTNITREVRGGTRFAGFSNAAPTPRSSVSGAPVAKSPETASAALKVAEAMRRGLKPKQS